MFKSLIKKSVHKLGFEISRTGSHSPQLPDGYGNGMQDGFQRLKSIGLIPESIIDVGAAEGTWTEKAIKVWTKARYQLFEPLEERRDVLKKLQDTHPGQIELVFAAAGSKEGETEFYVSDDLDGSGIASAGSTGRIRKVKIDSIDAMVSRDQLKPPFAIKLDTHGFEVPILQGAEKTMQETLFLIIECYGFYIAPGSLLFWQLCQYMDKQGFRLFDVVDIMRRPTDQAFWQCDAFFIRKEHPVFQNNSYAG